MRLVAFQPPIFPTLQGEGKLVGMPSVFVRMHGCDYSCEWCDTKPSWAPKSTWMELPVEEVVDRVKSYGLHHLVITGGNPMLQVNDVADLAAAVRQAWWDEKLKVWRPGMHVTLETQGSIFDQTALYHINLQSLSPKLHVAGWQDTIWPWLESAQGLPNLDTQIKLVVDSKEGYRDAMYFFEEVRHWWQRCNSAKDVPTFILQPESSRGRRLIESMCSWYEDTRRTQPRDTGEVRIIPQLHKTSLHVI